MNKTSILSYDVTLRRLPAPHIAYIDGEIEGRPFSSEWAECNISGEPVPDNAFWDTRWVHETAQADGFHL